MNAEWGHGGVMCVLADAVVDRNRANLDKLVGAEAIRLFPNHVPAARNRNAHRDGWCLVLPLARGTGEADAHDALTDFLATLDVGSAA